MIRSVLKRTSPSLVISCVALFVALGSAGYAATGGSFLLGKPNSAGNPPPLTSGTRGGPTLKVANSGGKPAASFTTKAGVSPFTVNRTAKVANLNADLLDGIDASGFVQAGVPLNADQLDGIDSLGFLLADATAGGDLSGPFGALELGAGVVTSAEVRD